MRLLKSGVLSGCFCFNSCLFAFRTLRTIHTNCDVPQHIERSVYTEIIKFHKDLKKLQTSLQQLKCVATDQLGKYKTIKNGQMEAIANAMCQVGFSMKEENPNSFVQIGMNTEGVAKICAGHTLAEWTPYHKIIKEYKWILHNLDQLLAQFVDVKQKNSKKQVLDPVLVKNFIIALYAEISHLRNVMKLEFRSVNKAFLEEKIRFHEEMCIHYENVYKKCFE